MKSSTLFFPIIFSIILFSCATFSKKDFRNDYSKISKEKLSQFNGDYKIYPEKKYVKERKYSNEDSLKKFENVFDKILADSILDNDTILNSIDDYKVRLNIVNENNLELLFLRENKLLRTYKIGGKLKSNGMFYLDNVYLKCHGVPYLLGGCINNKRRILLSKSNNLIVNTAIDNSGALLIIIGAGYSYNTSYEFKRIE